MAILMTITYQEQTALIEKFNVAARKVMKLIQEDYRETFYGVLWHKQEDDSIHFRYTLYDCRLVLTAWEDGEFETYTEGELKDDIDPIILLVERGFLALLWIISTQKPKRLPGILSSLLEVMIEEG
jgi:hypothetical protein